MAPLAQVKIHAQSPISDSTAAGTAHSCCNSASVASNAICSFSSTACKTLVPASRATPRGRSSPWPTSS